MMLLVSLLLLSQLNIGDTTCTVPSSPNDYTLLAPSAGSTLSNQSTLTVWCVDDSSVFSHLPDCSTQYILTCELDENGDPVEQFDIVPCEVGYLKPPSMFYDLSVTQIPNGTTGGDMFEPEIVMEVRRHSDGLVANETSCFAANLLLATSTATFPVLRQTEIQEVSIVSSNTPIVSGNFKLGIVVRGQVFSTNTLNHDTTADSFKYELENLPSLEYVVVDMNTTSNSVRWRVDFVSYSGNAPDIIILEQHSLEAQDSNDLVTLSITTTREGSYLPTTSVVNGQARFQGVAINNVGNHTLTVWCPALGIQVQTDTITVLRGPPSLLKLAEYALSQTTAGQTFVPQPQIIVSDIGGNVVSDLNEGYVDAIIQVNPGNATLGPAPVNTRQHIVNGVIQFSGLNLNVAATGYIIRFVTNLNLTKNYVEWIGCDIGIGDAHHINVINEPLSSSSPITGGREIPEQPVVSLHDSEGNLLIYDSTSFVRCEIENNRESGTLGRIEIQSLVLEHGFGESVTTQGQFRLRYIDLDTDTTRVTNILPFNLSAQDLEQELESFPEIDNVDVTFSTKNITYTGDYGLEVDVQERNSAPSCENGDVKLLSFPEGTPMMYFENAWVPICGHYFWENDHGCDLVCQKLGYDSGTTTKLQTPYDEDALEVGRCNSNDRISACTGMYNYYTKTAHCTAGNAVSVKCSCEGNNGGAERVCNTDDGTGDFYYHTKRNIWEVAFVSKKGNVPVMEILSSNEGGVNVEETVAGSNTVSETQEVVCKGVSGYATFTVPTQIQNEGAIDVEWDESTLSHVYSSKTFGSVSYSSPGATGIVPHDATSVELHQFLTTNVGSDSLVSSVSFESDRHERFCDSVGSNRVTLTYKPVLDLVDSLNVPSIALSNVESTLTSATSLPGNVTVSEMSAGSTSSIEIQFLRCFAVAGEVSLYVPSQKSTAGFQNGAIVTDSVLTDAIPYDANADTLKSYLTASGESLVSAVFYSSGKSKFCDSMGSNMIAILFNRPMDLVDSYDIPELEIVDSSNTLSGGDFVVSETISGDGTSSQETQEIICRATSGSFELLVPSQFQSTDTSGLVNMVSTGSIQFDVTEADLLTHLQSVSYSLVESVSYSSSGGSLCASDGSNVITVVFSHVVDYVSEADLNLPEMIVEDLSDLLLVASNDITISEVEMGREGQVEVQSLVCVATGGSATFFVPTQERSNPNTPGPVRDVVTTSLIPYDADETTMLELMTSSLAVGCPTRRECDSYEHRYPQAVNGVSSLIQQISFSSGTSMCTADGSNTVTITFHSVLDPVSNADDFDLELLLVDKSTLLLRGSNESECSECTAFDGYMNTALTKRNLFQIDETSQGCSDEAMCVDALTGLPQNIVSQVKNGVAHFRGLNIDRAAKRYTLRFTVVDYDPRTGWVETETLVRGETQPFDVEVGPIEYVRIVRSPEGIWAGGLQPFKTQPSVAITDAGGNVVVSDSTSSIRVDLSSQVASLLGTTSMNVTRGYANFTNIHIDLPGDDYKLSFVHEDTNISTNIEVDVVSSAEYMWSGGKPGDRVGEFVHIRGSLALIGAPGTDKAVDEIQRIHTLGGHEELVSEIQRFRTSALHRDVVQRITFNSTSNLTGHVTFMWAGRGPTRSIPLSGLHSTSLQAFLSEDLPGLSNRDRSILISDVESENENLLQFDVTFVSSNRSYAGCHTSLDAQANGTAPPGTPCSFPFVFNGRVYSYCTTDTHRDGASWCSTDPVYDGNWGECVCNDLNEVALLEVNMTGAIPEDSTASVEVLIPATRISGTFNLSFDSSNNNLVTIPWNASENEFKDALETLSSQNFRGDSVPLLVDNVIRTEAPTSEGGYTWTVTFTSDSTSYDVPSLSSVDDDLIGYGAQASAETLQNGAAPLGSTFRISYGTEGPSSELNFNASAEDVRAALEELPTVGNVFVMRDTVDASRNQFVWTVRFVSTYTQQTYGFVQDENYNLPSLVAETTDLSGTDARIFVETLREREIHMAPGLTEMGSPGLSAGAMYVLRSSVRDDMTEWTQSAILVPNVTDGADRFGQAACTDGESLIAIGAPSAQNIPKLEVRSIYEIRCSAETGTITLKFESSDDRVTLAYDDDAATVESKFRDVDIVIDVVVSPSNFANLCTIDTMPPPRRRVAIVMSSLVDTLVVERQENLDIEGEEEAFLSLNHLTDSELDEEYAERRAQQIGALYVYRKENDNSWSMDQMLVPAIASLALEPHEVGAMAFGSSVTTCESSETLRWLFVGAPSRRHRRGAVYVFRSDRSSNLDEWNEFSQTQQLGVESSLPGDDFGSSLAAVSVTEGTDTLAVSIPGLETSYTGGVCVDVPNWHDEHGRGCTYYSTNGCNNTNATESCCVCGYTGYSGVSNVSLTGGGGVAIFVRNSDTFLHDQTIRAPSSYYEDETGFGTSIALDRDVLVVGAPTESLIRTESYTSSSSRILRRVGAVYVYRRDSSVGPFRFVQRLVHTDAESHDSFGAKVALSGHILLVSRLAHVLQNSNTPRYAIARIQTTSTSTIAGSFVLTFRKRNINWDTNGWNRVLCYPNTKVPCHIKERDYLCTPCDHDVDDKVAPSATMRLDHDISAIDLQDHLTDLLGSSRIRVSRTPFGDSYGGHTWSVTFVVDASDDTLQEFFESVRFEAHSFLTGSDAQISIRVESANRAPAKHRKSVYAFTRLSSRDLFAEQAVLEPYYEQQTDRFGSDVSIDQGVAVVGAPNRDSYVTGQNNGAAFLYTISSFLDFRFASETISSEEDEQNAAHVEIKRCDPHCLESSVLCEDNGGVPMHGVCWTLGQNGNSCAETCASVGVKTPDQSTYVSSVMEDLLGSLDNIQIGLVARGPYECLDTGGLNVYNLHDRDESLVPTYEHDTWSHTHCQLACPCAFPDAQPDTPIGIEDVDINADYTEMEQTCASNHMRLCSASEICDWLTSSSNEFLDKWKIEQNVVQNNLEVWVPVNDNQDDWICTSPYGCDAGSTNRCDTPTGSEPAMVVNITERRLVCCGSLYPAPTTTSDQLHIQYATSDDLNSNYNIDESISREPPAYLPRSSALARKDCMSYSFAESNNKPDSCRWTDEQTTYDWYGYGDYAPHSSELRFGLHDVAKSFDIFITDDDITELPKEYAHLRLHKPGYRPSYFGKSWSLLEILSDDDGILGTRSYGHISFASDLPGTESVTAKKALAVSSNSNTDRGVLKSRQNDAFGSAIAQDDTFLFVGSPGRSTVYVSRNAYGVWEDTQMLTPPSQHTITRLTRFGESVAAHSGTLLVGSPGLAIAFMYRQQSNNYNLVAELPCPLGSSPSYRYGSAHAVALYDSYAVIGSYGAESVFVFRRQNSFNHSSWILHQTLNPNKQTGSRNRLGINTIRRSEFGYSVAIQEFTIVVGARREIVLNNISTSSSDELFHSSVDFDAIGSVYVFDGQIDSSAVVLSNTTVTFEMTTRLSPSSASGQSGHRNSLFGTVVAMDENTLVVSAVGDRAYADCTWNFETGNVNGWTRTGTAFNNQPVFGDNTMYRPAHQGRFHDSEGVVYTERFAYDPVEIAEGIYSPYEQVHAYQRFEGFSPANQSDDDSVNNNMTVFRSHNMTLSQCRDSCFYRYDACFGFVRPHPLVPEDEAECTHLEAWMYGDPIVTTTGRDIGVVPLVLNSTVQTFLKHDRVEPFYSSRDFSRIESSKSVRLEGRYFVGTFDHRPSESDIPGAIQGDEHVGAMWSAPFTIEGDTISFLIGGGCNARDERLELVVDGIGSVRVATGQCDETMRRVVWNVEEHVGKAGIIRAVDNSKDLWGHINFDDIRFSWGTSATSASGTVFVFRRHEKNDKYETACQCACVNQTTMSSCVCDRSDCEWTQETKLVPSDLRSDTKFGSSVDISGDVIVVGATKTSSRRHGDDEDEMTGSVYVYVRPETTTTTTYASWGVHGAYHTKSYSNMLEYKYEQASDLWSDEILRHNFNPHATSFEYAKLVPSISSGNLGTSISIRGFTLAVGSPIASTTPWNDKSGAVAVRDIESVSTLTFSNRVYTVSESQEIINLWVYRTSYASTFRELDVMYSTSDITAKGVKSSVFTDCVSQSIEDRGLICGDYEKTQGVLTFGINVTAVSIQVNITDDKCREDRTKEFVVSLGIVGNERIDSQYHEAIVRVEDDDRAMAYCQR